ncbi:TetR family transcriptional regulator [Bifidobacterium ramosum]|uniref:TetR family transcriptional regulator n=1 Tax=Bifidobacterium ramosum TaxID=1798158 RepID=A0A6L4X292_9BIFI|nr:TetR/AcrR family transcriptional regulator [Bifidobacterium ramosum]KAB8289111.1 TetR family transcriptional regulator [Bifidobacterium ramosum]NEG70824.1 TetR family transcriptional regulator [Bifidobacterium ramosum]
MQDKAQHNERDRGGKPRKHRPETEQKRREIIAAASQVFAEKGFNDGTLEEIAERTGLTRAGVLHHFGSKSALLMEVVKNRDVSGGQRREQTHIDHGEDWFRHLAATADDNAKHPGMVRLFTMMSGESVVKKNASMPYFRDRYRDLRNDLMASFVQMAKERKATINMAEAEMASSAIIAVMDGLQYQWLLQQGGENDETETSEDDSPVDLAEYTRYAINVIVAAVLEHHDDPPLIQ